MDPQEFTGSGSASKAYQLESGSKTGLTSLTRISLQVSQMYTLKSDPIRC
jgi:hypothetical protein